MKHAILHAFAISAAAMLALVTNSANAQTTAPGPYYATPSWDQTLPANTRFVVLSNFGNAAVLDRETGLVWERAPSTLTFAWANASLLCLQSFTGNREGWRLPAIPELTSLVDVTQALPALPVGHPFQNVLQGYWSITTSAFDATGALGMDTNHGTVFINNKNDGNSLHAWCVRGGSGADIQ